MEGRVKALSIRQPWIWAITHLDKRVENRSWGTRYRGPVLLHASQWWRQQQVIDSIHEMYRWLRTDEQLRFADNPPFLEDLKAARGCLVARAEIVDVIPPGGRPPPDQDCWYQGEYGLLLDRVILLPKPILCPGKLGLFEVSPSIVERP